MRGELFILFGILFIIIQPAAASKVTDNISVVVQTDKAVYTLTDVVYLNVTATNNGPDVNISFNDCQRTDFNISNESGEMFKTDFSYCQEIAEFTFYHNCSISNSYSWNLSKPDEIFLQLNRSFVPGNYSITGWLVGSVWDYAELNRTRLPIYSEPVEFQIVPNESVVDASNITVVVRTDRAVYNLTDIVNLNITATNNGPDVNISFNDCQRTDFNISNESGEMFTTSFVYCMEFKEFIFYHNDSINDSYSWNLSHPKEIFLPLNRSFVPGNYSITGWLVGGVWDSEMNRTRLPIYSEPVEFQVVTNETAGQEIITPTPMPTQRRRSSSSSSHASTWKVTPTTEKTPTPTTTPTISPTAISDLELGVNRTDAQAGGAGMDIEPTPTQGLPGFNFSICIVALLMLYLTKKIKNGS